MFKKQIIKRILKIIECAEYGSISIWFPNGKNYKFVGSKNGVNADITIKDFRSLSSFLQKGDIGFAESYREDWWMSSNISKLFIFALQNEKNFDKLIYGNFLTNIASKMYYLLSQNTLKSSKKNIAAHYDLGNDFFSLWLDKSMTYSAALFKNDNDNLTQAQQSKYDQIIKKMKKSGKVLEMGCGWGGFINRACQKGDYDIKGITLSASQYKYVHNVLGQKAEIALEDYRKQTGKYDHIVSIEMFEAVGEKYWPIYFSKIKSLLNKNGNAIIQTITIKEQYFKRYRSGGDSIRSFIFPGGMLPSFERFKAACNDAGLILNDSFFFGKDYAKTLQIWLNRFEEKTEDIKKLGFDDKFIRIWKFYLSFCIASFTTERTNVGQLELTQA